MNFNLYFSSECCDANCPKHVDLSKYNPLSVKYLMEYLSDFKDLLQGCKELTVLGDILILCDYYGIGKPVTEIRNVVYETAIDFSNAIESFEVSRKIELIDAFADLASHLRMKSASFLRFNLAGWQLLIYFLVANENKIDIAVDILEELAEKEEALIRYFYY